MIGDPNWRALVALGLAAVEAPQNLQTQFFLLGNRSLAVS